jgi:bacterioferritin-associated ferredoxin
MISIHQHVTVGKQCTCAVGAAESVVQGASRRPFCRRRVVN